MQKFLDLFIALLILAATKITFDEGYAHACVIPFVRH